MSDFVPFTSTVSFVTRVFSNPKGTPVSRGVIATGAGAAGSASRSRKSMNLRDQKEKKKKCK